MCGTWGRRTLALVLFLLGAGALGQQTASYSSGMAAFHAGRYAEAASLLAQAEESSPGKTNALLYMGKSFINLKQYDHAEVALRSYLSKHSRNSDSLYLLGYVLNREGRPGESLKVMNQASAVAPPAGDDLKIVALDYVLLNDYEDALHWLEKAVSLDPKNVEAWYSLGRVDYSLQRYSDAKDAYARVLKLDPENVKAENNLGLVYEMEMKTGAAVEAYRTAIEWEEGKPKRSEQPYLNLGSLLLEEGKDAEAIPLLQQAVHLAPDNPFCRAKLGRGYAEDGQMELAKQELERAIAFAPNDAAMHFQLGRILARMGLRTQAKAEFDRCRQILSARGGEPKH